MRVISGSAGGRTLYPPKSGETRPTSDLVRGMIFNVLDNVAENWSRVLDLYAGSGALGIEALSRGAESAVFVERSNDACLAIRKNLTQLGFEKNATMVRQAVENALDGLTGTFGLIFLDPPYADEGIEKVVRKLAGSALLAEDSVVVVEHRRNRTFAEDFNRLELFKERRHGDTVVSFFRVKE